MKTPVLFIAVTALLSVPLFHATAEPQSAGRNWSSSVGNQSAYERGIKSNTADMIAKAKGGFYDGFNTYNSYYSSTNIGSQIIISDSVITGAEVGAINCGPVTTQAQLDENNLNQTDSTGDNTCDVGGSHAD
ncbi:hypothetical protein [Sneathiella chinensis]|uniref:Uncharacterized protein n=1 Tax=Sneathiella chinensis TaxID=349750 RepID=A0ABQ5U8B1_9PROT|nr:hypothetical protein [Sneathiella chinensis]GLQ07641.1 hypothetical protein GCM10007924_28620 [Sneathiella chinensis]